MDEIRNPAEEGLDCIVRFHDVRRLAELERCVFSLVGQRYRPLTINLILQRFTAEQVAATEAALAPLMRLPDPPRLRLHNWNEPGIADARTCLLNHGLEVAEGRYLAFLDYDDVLFPEAYELLVSKLRESRAAIAFASVQVMQAELRAHLFRVVGTKVPPYSGTGLADLFENNFCPIHSYVIDRSLVPAEILHFDSTLTIEEDYDLLLRICAQCPSDFSLVGTEIGYYFYKTDGSNTVATQGGLEGERLALYRTVQARIRERKQTTPVAPAVQARLGLPHPREGLSILDVQKMLQAYGKSWRKVLGLAPAQ